MVVAVSAGAPVYLRNVADVPRRLRRNDHLRLACGAHRARPKRAVTIAVAKRKGANATQVTRTVLEPCQRVPEAGCSRATCVLDVTRDYGETAGDKAQRIDSATSSSRRISVTVLIWIFLGWREALVVLVAVPVTLALTLFAYYALGYTLNRITLFALIFSIGILVDDAIVVVENIYRHLQLGDRAPEVAAVEAVDEVGNPTILATFTVIAAILPMAFVTGMMGPYMRPIPVGASVAMLASLGVAFIDHAVPRVPRCSRDTSRHDARAARSAHRRGARGRCRRVSRRRLYARIMTPLMDRRRLASGVLRQRRRAAPGGRRHCSLVKAVKVKMLPFDNKSEFQVVLDLARRDDARDDERARPRRSRATCALCPRCRSTEVYAGTAAPFNFNGLVRHYFMRRGANVGDVQVNLVPKGERSRQSHAIAVAVRPGIDSIARALSTRRRRWRRFRPDRRCCRRWSPKSTPPTTRRVSRRRGR